MTSEMTIICRSLMIASRSQFVHFHCLSIESDEFATIELLVESTDNRLDIDTLNVDPVARCSPALHCLFFVISVH